MNDKNYNARVVFEDETSVLVYVNRLSNEGLTNWKGWLCNAGVDAIMIYQDEIYGGNCRNDKLGSFESGWALLEESTVCKQEKCYGCTTDLMQYKQRP